MSVSLQEQISTLFSCLAMGLGVGLLYDLPGRRPVSGLGDSAPPVAYSCSHGSVGKNFKKVEKNLEKVLFFFPVVEYNMSSNRETWQICRP